MVWEGCVKGNMERWRCKVEGDEEKRKFVQIESR